MEPTPTTPLFREFALAIWSADPSVALVESLDEWPERVRIWMSKFAKRLGVAEDAPGIGVRADRGQLFVGYRFIAPSAPAPDSWFILEVTGAGRAAWNLCAYRDDRWDLWSYRSALGLSRHSPNFPQAYKRAPWASTAASPLEQIIEREEQEPD